LLLSGTWLLLSVLWDATVQLGFAHFALHVDSFDLWFSLQVSGSMIYFQRVLVVSRAVKGSTQRTAFFALLNTYSAFAVLLLQLTASSGMLRVLGVPAALALGPGGCAC
jgi:hypothetical protein